jgi:hypothetical protein
MAEEITILPTRRPADAEEMMGLLGYQCFTCASKKVVDGLEVLCRECPFRQ